LPRKHGNVLWRRRTAELDVFPASGFLFFRIQEKDLLTAKRERQRLPIIGRTLPRNGFTLTISTFKTEIWHFQSSPLPHIFSLWTAHL
jgi:hypothetical protein